MGKKGSWFSAIKKVFTHNSKEKVADGGEKKSSKERKKGTGKLKHGDGHSYLPFGRETSSIEKILGEVERGYQTTTDNDPPPPPEQPKATATPYPTPPPVRTAAPPVRTASPPKVQTPPSVTISPKDASPPKEANPVQWHPPSRETTQPVPPRVPSPPLRRVSSSPRATTPVNAATPAKDPSSRFVQNPRPELTIREQHATATKIQAAYRGYTARKSFRAIKGLVRLQAVMKGHNVKRQTSNALKCMQMLVHVQNQIQSRRIQMLDDQVMQRQSLYKNDQDLESSFGKWMSENQEEWDDSTLTKEEIETRMKRKFDAIIKRERALTYAYSHQSSKSTPRLANGALADFRSGGYPYWWNWLENRQVPPLTPTNPSRSPAIRNFLTTPSRTPTDFKVTPVHHSSNLGSLGFDNMDTPTPRSTRSSVAPRSRQAKTPPSRLQPRYARGSAATSPFNGKTFKDDDSLMSCPAFSVPRYMAPTASANAKLKGIPDSPGSTTTDDSKRRMSFPFTQGVGSFKWKKGKETSSPSPSVLGKNQSVQSVRNLSVDSSVSMPATVGRKPFNRFA